MKESVYLIGCRAVGKSSIGRELAHTLSWSFLDTDTLITENFGQTVAEIVQDGGWKKFRNAEKKILLQLQNKKKCVVATGGGAVLHGDVWPELKKKGNVIWLTADIATLCARIRGDQQSASLRPSLTGNDICLELEDVLVERSPLYKAFADCVIDTGVLDVGQAVLKITNYVKGIQ